MGPLRTESAPPRGLPAVARSGSRARRSANLGLWVGGGLLAVYLAAGLSALYVFRGSLGTLSEDLAWDAPTHSMAPSWGHPFGIMPGFGTDLFRAVWQATPWDLAIVAGILSIAVLLGFFLGGLPASTRAGDWTLASPSSGTPWPRFPRSCS